ncbi:uncharacterized protein LOC110688330 [Chenopodium quinoa]|uniref:uncharacterized protein LOC110688330 n=1 Tax=Chenopodium quinoa TaxID=63459 RepID=UPI000B77A7D0|nr:uncharacterized protein LOC110688330 [Chenopodium quinoa]
MSTNMDNVEGNVPIEEHESDNEKSKPKRKRMKDRSEVWEHFIKEETHTGMEARCKYCGMRYKCGTKRNGTSPLWAHINRCLASESAFSTGGRVLDPFRSSLTPRVVEGLVCAQNWLRSSPFPNIEECLQEVEDLEEDLRNMTIGGQNPDLIELD